MPNYVHHHLTITGPETERERFMAECFSHANDKTNFDFDKLVPQPEHIKDEGNVRTLYSDGVRMKFPDWYLWRCENWGTKWNALDTTFAREGESILLSFDTAWAPPVPIFHEVARRFPNLRVEGSLIEEMYNFGANILCQNGNVEFVDRTEEIRSAFEAAMHDASARA
jgi:hypothetical protein